MPLDPDTPAGPRRNRSQGTPLPSPDNRLSVAQRRIRHLKRRLKNDEVVLETVPPAAPELPVPQLPQASEPRQRKIPWLFLSCVVLPLGLLTIYLCLISSNRFSSGARLALRSTQVQPNADGLSLLAGLGLGSGPSDTEQLADFLRSGDLADRLDHELGLRAHFSAKTIDWWNRLAGDATREDFLDEYARRVTVTVDPLSHTVQLDFESYSPPYGVQIVERMVAAAEAFENTTSQDLAKRRLDFLQTHLSQAETRLSTARRASLAFQIEHGLPDPQSVGVAAATRMAGLESALTEARTTLRTLRGYLSVESAEVKAAQARIDAISGQLSEEKANAIGSEKDALAPLLSRYADLLIAQEFALEAYRTLLAATEQTRVEASEAPTVLVAVERPIPGERPAYPQKLYILGSAAVILLALWLIVRMLLATLREQRES